MSVPCRSSDCASLSRLFPGGGAPVPSSAVVLCGPPRCGKSLVASTVLGSLPHLRVAYASCQQGTVHPRLIFEPLLCQLLGLERGSSSGLSSPVRCDTLGEFAEQLATSKDQIFCNGATAAILVLRNAERLRDLDANLLPGLLRLKELSGGVNVCAVLLTRVSFNKFLTPSGLPKPFVVRLKAYGRDQLAQIIAEKLREGERKPLEEEFYHGFAKLIISFSLPSCNSLPELLWLSRSLFPRYRGPVDRKEVEADNVRALYRQVEAPLKEALAGAMHLKEREDTSLSKEDKEGSSYASRRLHVELPFHSKFLLIAAYLASYNPEKSDKRFFLKHHGKQRKTAQSMAAKVSRQSLHLLGPKAFPLDRLLAIFYSIVEDDVVPSVNVLSQVATLVTLQFLTHVSSEDSLDQPKYKCIVSLEFIAQISKQVDFEIRHYLFDFV